MLFSINQTNDYIFSPFLSDLQNLNSACFEIFIPITRNTRCPIHHVYAWVTVMLRTTK